MPKKEIGPRSAAEDVIFCGGNVFHHIISLIRLCLMVEFLALWIDIHVLYIYSI